MRNRTSSRDRLLQVEHMADFLSGGGFDVADLEWLVDEYLRLKQGMLNASENSIPITPALGSQLKIFRELNPAFATSDIQDIISFCLGYTTGGLHTDRRK